MRTLGSPSDANKDALILATAELEGLPVVTMETKPRNRRRMATWYPAVRLLGLEDLRALARGGRMTKTPVLGDRSDADGHRAITTLALANLLRDRIPDV